MLYGVTFHLILSCFFMAEQWNKLLKSLGFTESESAIYLLSLEMGPASVQNLARKAHVSRVTTYAVIESLSSHGLMSSMQKGKKKLYASESPERLLSFVGGRVKTLEATFKEVEQLLPDLKLLQRGERPLVKFFEGKEGVAAFVTDVMQVKPATFDEFGDHDAIRSMVPVEELQPLWAWMDQSKVKTRFMYSGKKGNDTRRAAEYTITKHIEPGMLPFSFTGDVFIYGSRIALATFKSKMVVVIVESQELADTMRGLYEFAWIGMGPKKKSDPTDATSTQEST